MSYKREEFNQEIESEIERFNFTRLFEDLSDLRVVSLDLKLDLQIVFPEISNLIFNSKHLNKLTLYHQEKASKFDNLQTRGMNIATDALISLGSGERVFKLPDHICNDINFCEDNGKSLV